MVTLYESQNINLSACYWDTSSPCQSAEFWTLTFLMPMVTVQPFLPVKKYETASSPF